VLKIWSITIRKENLLDSVIKSHFANFSSMESAKKATNVTTFIQTIHPNLKQTSRVEVTTCLHQVETTQRINLLEKEDLLLEDTSLVTSRANSERNVSK
jgi:hypothetical protein